MNRRAYFVAFTAILMGTALIVFWMQSRDEQPSGPAVQKPIPPDDEDQFVGSARCGECHAQIAASYGAHPMSQSAGYLKAIPTSPGPTEFSIGAIHYEIENRTGTFFHRERVRDKNGDTLAAREIPIHLVIGSGIRAKSFLTAHDGVLFQSPLTWYAERRKWDLSPGFQPNKIDRFERRIGDACLFCHVGRTASIRRETDGRYHAQKPFHEAGIGCERCHGPGRRHIELFEGDVAKRNGQTGIVNPAKLDDPAREAICYQCHLTAKRVLKYGRREYDFRPGNSLSTVWTMWVEANRGDGKEHEKAVTHVQQMHASKCFQASGGKMTCLSCHDPHSVPSPDSKITFYRERCQKCHTPDADCKMSLPIRKKKSPENSCIDCHMPRRGTADIAHLTQSDHRIIRFLKPQRASEKHHTPIELALFGSDAKQLPEWELERGRGIAYYQQFLESPIPAYLEKSRGLLERSVAKVPDDAAARRTLAAVYQLKDNFAKAREQLEVVVQLAPDDDDSLAMLGVACYRTGDFQAGLKYFERALKLNPWHAETYGRLAEIQASFGDLDAAISSLKRGIALNPTYPELRAALARYLAKRGEVAKANEQQELNDKIRQALP